MHIKEYIEKIVADGDIKEMEELSEMLEEVIYHFKTCDYEKYCEYKMDLYRMAYGDVLNKDMAEDIVSKMKPYGEKWTLQQTKQVQEEYGLEKIRDIDFFVVMNSAYNDYHDLFDEDLKMYVKFAENFIKDEDAKEGKVFIYFMEIPRDK